LLPTSNSIFGVLSFLYVVWFVNFATEPQINRMALFVHGAIVERSLVGGRTLERELEAIKRTRIGSQNFLD
jgi:hypothetical protein